MKCSGEHFRTCISSPWWEWACQKCSPALYRLMTKNGPVGSSRCPFCLTVKNLNAEGKYPKHGEDGDRCRSSGLSRRVALILFEAIIKGKNVDHMAALIPTDYEPKPFPLHPGEAMPNSPEPNRPGSHIITQLAAIRQQRGMTVREVSQSIGRTHDTVHKYENLERTMSTDLVVSWAALFGRSISLRHVRDLDDFVVNSFRETAHFLAQERKAMDMTVEDLAKLIRSGSPSNRATIWGRETGHIKDIMFSELCTWAAAIGYTVELSS